jgi:putative DNA primase/helicase
MSKSEKSTKQANLKTLKKLLMKPSEFRTLNTEGKACISFDYKTYAYFDNWNIALNIINNLPEGNNVCNELILEHSKVKPYFDIEYIREELPNLDPDKLKIDIKEKLIAIFKKEWDYNLVMSDIYFSTCHRRKDENIYKYSFHAVVSTHNPAVVFENANKASYLADKLQSEFEDEYKHIIDKSVYSKTQNFRLVNHCKVSETGHPFKLEDGDRLEETLVTKIDKLHLILPALEQADLATKHIKNITRETSDEYPDLILEKVQELHTTAYFERVDTNGFYQFNYTERYEPCFCYPNPTVFHEKIGFYAYIYNGIIYAGCYSGRCRDEQNRPIHKILGNVNTQKTPEFEKVDFSNEFKLDSAFVMNCISNDALGISDLFVKMYLDPKRIKWVNESKNGSTYFWNGSLWQEDDYSFVERLLVITTVKVIRQSIEALRSNTEVEDEEYEMKLEKADKMVTKLNSGGIINNVLRFVKPLTRDLEFAKIKDIHPSMLSCKNGMLNLVTGELRKAVPQDNITKCIDVEYNLNACYNDFDRFIRQITSSEEGENIELYDYLKWCIGYAMQGNPRKKMFIILFGPHGFNGKSLLMNTISDVLEHYAVAMDKSVVLEGPKKTAGSHSTEIVQLENCRFGILSDTNEDAAIDDGQIKQLTGITDKLSVREIFGKQKEFTPVFVPFISTNHPIKINLTDKAMYERLVLVPFVLSFVDTPVKSFERKNDPTLAEKFKRNKSGILKWLVEASIYYNENYNKNPPKCIHEAKEIYNKQVNPYLDFINKCFTKSDNEADKIKRQELLQLYKDYLRENNAKFVAKTAEREFDKLLPNQKIRNCKYYTGLIYINEDSEPEDNL